MKQEIRILTPEEAKLSDQVRDLVCNYDIAAVLAQLKDFAEDGILACKDEPDLFGPGDLAYWTEVFNVLAPAYAAIAKIPVR